MTDRLENTSDFTKSVLLEAFRGASAGDAVKPGEVHLTAAAREAGKGAELAASALASGAVLVVERLQSPAGKAISDYAAANPRTAVIKREQEAARELARRVRR